MRRVLRYWLVLLVLFCFSPGLQAQAKLDNGQLDQILAPVALYPDALLSQLLMASTYPADVASAAQWSKSNSQLSGDAAVKAVQNEPWDPTVQSLTAFPSVLDMMGREPAWVQSVGDAFLDQPEDVMNAVQRLRLQAQKAGTLATNEQQKITTATEGTSTVVRIEPAAPQVVYVPTYNPATVYGTWAYPSYPPVYYPPPPGSAFASAIVSGIGFGVGLAVADSMWGGFDWGHHDVDINVNRYNNINANNRLDVSNNNVKWNHDPARRGDTPYKSAATQQQFDEKRQTAQRSGANRPDARARPASADDQARRERAQQTMRERGSGAPKAGSGAAAKAGGGGAPKAAAAARDGGGRDVSPGAKQRSDEKSAAIARSRDSNRDSALRGAGGANQARQPAQTANAPRATPQRERTSPPKASAPRDGGGGGGGGHGQRGRGHGR